MRRGAGTAHRNIRVRNIATGLVFDAWPVDAREMLTHPKGGVEAVPPDTPLGIQGDPGKPLERVPTPAPAEAATRPATPAELLADKAYRDLQLLAKRAGIDAGGKKEELIAALVPLVEAGAVSLEELPKVAPDPVQFPHIET